MKSLRARLFVSVGVIFLIVAFLNFLLPELLVQKDLNRSQVYLTQRFESVQKQILDISSFFVTYRIIESAADLEGISEMTINASRLPQSKKDTPTYWELASQVATYNSQIAFVQMTSENQSAVVIPIDAKLYIPQWASIDDEMLWIKIPEKNAIFLAIPFRKETNQLYFLFQEETLKSFSQEKSQLESFEGDLKRHLQQAISKPPVIPQNFYAFEKKASPITTQSSVEQLYDTLLIKETQWVEKMHLIRTLAPWLGTEKISPDGILAIDARFQQGACVLTKEAFPKTPILTSSLPKQRELIPYVFLRKTSGQTDLDLVSQFFSEDILVGLSISISEIVKKIALLLQKPIIITRGNEALLGFTSQGKQFDVGDFGFTITDEKLSQLEWQGKKYVPQVIHLEHLNLIVLTPADEANVLARFVIQMNEKITKKISLNLMGVALASLALALILLEIIAQKITHPISMLATASEELGKGKYDDLKLPTKKHNDEVSMLTHSFEKMVLALRDREKIRGVLNKVVSKEIAEQILKSSIELGGEERVVTMLFSDIRGFTHLSENLDPQFLISLLNEYMTRMCRIVDETYGVVDKFVGDEIMALYGAPLPLERHAVHAVDSALLMIHHLKEWNRERKEKKEIVFEPGIGIHTGLVFSGNMGAENRLNYTVIGANVNLAARICSKAAPMQILISGDTWNEEAVQKRFRVQQLAPVELKGIDQPVPVYEVLGLK